MKSLRDILKAVHQNIVNFSTREEGSSVEKKFVACFEIKPVRVGASGRLRTFVFRTVYGSISVPSLCISTVVMQHFYVTLDWAFAI